MKKIVFLLAILSIILIKDDIKTGSIRPSKNNFYASDSRWKVNVQNLESTLEKIGKLRGVSFEYKIKEFPEKNFEKGTQVGFIAQEIEQVIPEIVKTDDKGYKSVDYAKVTPFLVEAMKEQQKQIDNQKFVIEKLQKENQQLKNEFNKLKSNVDKLLMDKTSQMKTPDKAKDSDTKK